jgi:hypothetical protein
MLLQRKQPGFLVSLDLFHAYDRVDLRWVDQVLMAMGFGPTFRGWIQTLHSGASTCFMLHTLTIDLLIAFSLRQGDPLAMILFIIQIEPLLALLQQRLVGLNVGRIREASLGYVDDVATLGHQEADLFTLDTTVREFESVSGAILNRNRKSVLVGLGSWAGREEWPLDWIRVAKEVKIYGITFTASHVATTRLTWDRVISGLEATLRAWSHRHLPTLLMKRNALEIFALSKLWYHAQILPLPPACVQRIKQVAGAFLWAGRLERLAYDELYVPLHQGGLGLTCVATRAQALLAKQACHRLANGGRPAGHLAYWLGITLRGHLPHLLNGPHADLVPTYMKNLATLLIEVFTLDVVEVGHLETVTAKIIYSEFLSTPPPPKVEYNRPRIGWPQVWSHLATIGLPQAAVDVGFSAIHNILPLQIRRHRLRITPSPACRRCGAAMEDVIHFFTACPRVADAWSALATIAGRTLGGPVHDANLLHLFMPPRYPIDRSVTLAILSHMEVAWATRDNDGPLVLEAVKASVCQAVKTGAAVRAGLVSIFD